jgi:non-specific serine/threonine protein kinase
LGADTGPWARRIEVEHDNVRAALGWCLREGCSVDDAAVGVTLVKWLGVFWNTYAYQVEGLAWMNRALLHIDAAHAARTRAQVLILIAEFENTFGDCVHAEKAAVAALQTFRELDTHFELMRALQIRAAIGLHTGRGEMALPLIEEWLQLARTLGNARYEGIAQFWLGVVAAQQRDFAGALEHYAESLRVIPPSENGTRIATLFYQAETWWCLGDHERAMAQCERSLAHFRETGFAFGVGTALHRIGDIALFQGDVVQARRCYAESIATLYQRSARQRLIWPLAGLATLLTAEERNFAAVALWSAVQAIGQLVGLPTDMISYPTYQKHIAAARASMSTEEITEAERKGQALNLDQAVAYALSECAAN